MSPYDRTIVIDTQPLFSASVLASLIIEGGQPHGSSGSGGPVPGAGSSGILADIAGKNHSPLPPDSKMKSWGQGMLCLLKCPPCGSLYF